MDAAMILDKGIESKRLDTISIEDLNSKMKSLSEKFDASGLSPETFSLDRRIELGDGQVKEFYKNLEGHDLIKLFNSDHRLIQTIQKVGGDVRTTYYDLNQNPYLCDNRAYSGGNPKFISLDLIPNSHVVLENNFEADVDSQGRLIRAKMADLKFRVVGDKPAVPGKIKKGFTEGLDASHAIPEEAGGPMSKANIFPATEHVNEYYMKRVEQIAKDLTKEGHKVDYEMGAHYSDLKSKIPSSFEPKIFSDGIEVELPKELRKFYNVDDPTMLQKAAINVKEVKTNVTSSAVRTLEKTQSFHRTGLDSGAEAALITCAVSTVDNVMDYVQGDISGPEAAANIAKETGAAGAIGYGTGFVTKAVAQGMQASSHTLINSLGKFSVPAAVISFGVTSFDTVSDFAKGEIDGRELAYNLGENAAGVAGGVAGSVAAGALVGSVVPGAGTVVGAAAGLVGGMVGTAVASEAYATAVEVGSAGADVLKDKMTEVANQTVETAKAELPEAVDTVREALNSFASENNLPFQV